MKDLDHLKTRLEQLTHYLQDYLPLANAHVADFFIDDYWQRFLPAEIREELLELNSNELALLPSGALCQNAPGVNKLKQGTEGNSENLTPKLCCSSLDKSTSSVRLSTAAKIEGKEEEHRKNKKLLWDRSRCPVWRQKNLENFINVVQQHTLTALDVLSDLDELLISWQGTCTDKVMIRQFMSEKKSHEVDAMSHVCASLASYLNIKNVVDIGSGRGYLSSHLTLMYGLHVLAVDSQDVNTHSAQIRSQRLKKHWNGLLRGSKVKETASVTGPRSVHCEKSPRTDEIVNTDSEKRAKIIKSASDEKVASQSRDSGCAIQGEADKKKDKETEAKPSINEEQSLEMSSCVSITKFITPDTNLQDLIKTHLVLRHRTRGQESDNFEEGDHDFGDATHEPGILLTGLHTCGNLAASMLRLFIGGDGSAKAVCNVGCCYHHLDEEFTRSPFLASSDAPDPECNGFPLSNQLLGKEVQLGRNARMLASQTPARMANTGQISHTSLFYRALLQVLLRDLTGEVRDDWQVGKIFAKSRNFSDYVRRALQKLGLDDGGKFTEEVLTKYLDCYAEKQRRLSAFVQLRAALAPCIEALILLDRLVYIREQPCVKEAHLVRMFDPVTSPRCYGIIAFRWEYQS